MICLVRERKVPLYAFPMEPKNIEEIALRLQDVGIAALTIHGRTRAQMYRGEADWTLIGAVKNNPAIRILSLIHI